METCKKFNLRQASQTKLNISPDDIPTLTPNKFMSEWMKGDDNPYYKIQAIKYPIMANGYNYTESFFESFLAKTNKRAIPGSRDGHHLGHDGRGGTDLLLVGGKLDRKGNGKGTVYFKNYIPPVGASGDNSIFIRENRTDMVDYSIVSYTRDEVTTDKKGNQVVNVVESLFGERNDAVGYGEGAMEQKTNAQEGHENITEESSVTKEEVLQKLNSLKANADITLPEIAKSLGLENMLRTLEDDEAIAKLNAIKEVVGEDDPVELINRMKKNLAENEKSVREAKLTENFGPEKYENDKLNELRYYASTKLNALTDQAIEEFRKDPIAIKLAGERMDQNSKVNRVETNPVDNDDFLNREVI